MNFSAKVRARGLTVGGNLKQEKESTYEVEEFIDRGRVEIARFGSYGDSYGFRPTVDFLIM